MLMKARRVYCQICNCKYTYIGYDEVIVSHNVLGHECPNCSITMSVEVPVTITINDNGKCVCKDG